MTSAWGWELDEALQGKIQEKQLGPDYFPRRRARRKWNYFTGIP